MTWSIPGQIGPKYAKVSMIESRNSKYYFWRASFFVDLPFPVVFKKSITSLLPVGILATYLSTNPSAHGLHFPWK